MSTLGVVLAGGLGRRLGGDKALVALDGVPLVHYPIAVLRDVLGPPVIVAKPSTVLPLLPSDIEVWDEPEAPAHPVVGIRHALRRAGGRSVLVVAVDLPLLDAETVVAILAADPNGTAACVVPRAGGRLHPLCAVWRPAALGVLDAAEPDARLTTLVARLDPVVVDLADPTVLTNVNTPQDLLDVIALRGGATR